MKNKVLNLLIAALLVFAVLIAANPVSAHGEGASLSGVISAIDSGASSLTVTPKAGGPDVVLKVDGSTIITRFHHAATLADLQPGDRVDVQYDPSTMLATRIKADLNLVDLIGVASAIDTAGSTLTVTPKMGGANVVLKVDSTTFIQRNGKSATLAGIQLGDLIMAKYNPVTFLAARISARLNLVDLQGFVTAIDTASSSLTVMPKKGGANVVLKVDSTTVIKRTGKPAALADIQLGDLVVAKYNPVTYLAARISAWMYLVDLKGVVSAIDTAGGSLTVTPRKGGAQVVLKVDSTTVIKRNGKPAALADIQLGDLITAKYNPVTFLATNLSAWLNLVPLNGTISAVDTTAQTLTVTPIKGGAELVLKVDSTTVIKRNNATASLADLLAGDRVEAKYNPVTMLAAWINAKRTLAEVHGTIFAVDTGAGTLTVTPGKGGANIVLKVNASTIIKRNEAPASLADLQVGDLVQARYDPATMFAIKVEAKVNLADLEGTVSAVDGGAGTVTITPENGGADVVLKVDATTMIKRNDAPAALADLQVGDLVKAKYDPVTMLAVWISAKVSLAELEGTISAVDTGAGTLTVSPKDGGTDIVLKVDATTIIKRNDAPATPADLQVGDRVEAWYNQATMLAVKIEAKANLAELEGTISAVDTGAGTVTVTPKDGGADVVLKVDGNTQIKRNDDPAVLADLQAGDRLRAMYDQASMLAVKISVEH